MEVASRSRRLGVLFGNWFLGGLPLTVPIMLERYGDTEYWTTNPMELNVVMFGLLMVQLAVVYFGGGSPGALIAGLRVRRADGSRLGAGRSLLRALPYIGYLFASRYFYLTEGAGVMGRILGAIWWLSLALIASSAWIGFMSGFSLLDRLTGSVLVKAAKSEEIRPLPRRRGWMCFR